MLEIYNANMAQAELCFEFIRLARVASECGYYDAEEYEIERANRVRLYDDEQLRIDEILEAPMIRERRS
jgi:hypothetical protein